MNDLMHPTTDEVTLEPCDAFRLGISDDGLVCEECGWLTDEHEASTIPLPRAS